MKEELNIQINEEVSVSQQKGKDSELYWIKNKFMYVWEMQIGIGVY